MKTARAGREPEVTISGLRVRPVDVVSERPVQTAAGLEWDEAEVRRWAFS